MDYINTYIGILSGHGSYSVHQDRFKKECNDSTSSNNIEYNDSNNIHIIINENK